MCSRGCVVNMMKSGFLIAPGTSMNRILHENNYEFTAAW